jgi:hypothetical protein
LETCIETAPRVLFCFFFGARIFLMATEVAGGHRCESCKRDTLRTETSLSQISVAEGLIYLPDVDVVVLALGTLLPSLWLLYVYLPDYFFRVSSLHVIPLVSSWPLTSPRTTCSQTHELYTCYRCHGFREKGDIVYCIWHPNYQKLPSPSIVIT